MEDLIYQFLLQSGYPRASLIADMSMLPKLPLGDGNGTVPTFVVVDPDNAQCLAVIKVIAAGDAEGFDQYALTTGQFANQIGGDTVQGFVINVDFNASEESQQVQFFRVWPGDQPAQLSAKTFPDIDTLKISNKLAVSGARHNDADGVRHRARAFGRTPSAHGAGPQGVGMLGLYLPAALLMVLLVIDFFLESFTGTGIVSSAQSHLAVGIALLSTLPAAIRYLGAVSKQRN